MPDLYARARSNCSKARKTVRSQPAERWKGPFPLPDPLREYYSAFGPWNVSLRGYGNGFYFPRLSELWKYQEGYRWFAGTDEPVDDWPDDWLVVADQGSDPFLFSRESGAVLYAMHGAGRWDVDVIFPDLATMAAALTGLGALCEEAGTGLADDDGILRPVWVQRMLSELADVMGSEDEAAGVLHTMEWMLRADS